MRITSSQVASVVNLLKVTPERIGALTSGLPDTVLKQRPGEDVWSATEILAHLRACSDVWGGSIIRMIAEDNPKLRYVSPRTWIRKTDYNALDFQTSLSAFNNQRVELLHKVSGLRINDWSRAATFSGTTKGRHQTVLDYATRMAEHEKSHCAQIEAVLKRLVS